MRSDALRVLEQGEADRLKQEREAAAAAEAERQKQLGTALGTIGYSAGVAAGKYAPYEQALHGLNKQFDDWTDTLRDLGATQAQVAEIEAMRSDALRVLEQGEGDRLKQEQQAANKSWADLLHNAEVAAGIWSDADLALYDLNMQFDTMVATAIALGRSEADLIQIEELRTAAIKRLTDAQSQNAVATNNYWQQQYDWYQALRERTDDLRERLQGVITQANAPVGMQGQIADYNDWVQEIQEQLAGIPRYFTDQAYEYGRGWYTTSYENSAYKQLEALFNQAKAVKWAEIKDNFTKPLYDIIASGALDTLNSQMAELADWYREQATLAGQLGETDLLNEALAVQAQQVIDNYLKPINSAWQSFLDATTMGALAPVQSMETFQNRYDELTAQAQAGNAQAFQDLLSFATGQYLPFLQGYGGDYADLVNSITAQLDAVRQDLISVSLEESMQTVVDRLGEGSPLYNILADIRDGLAPAGGGGGGQVVITLEVDGRKWQEIVVEGLRSNAALIRAVREAVA